MMTKQNKNKINLPIQNSPVMYVSHQIADPKILKVSKTKSIKFPKIQKL